MLLKLEAIKLYIPHLMWLKDRGGNLLQVFASKQNIYCISKKDLPLACSTDPTKVRVALEASTLGTVAKCLWRICLMSDVCRQMPSLVSFPHCTETGSSVEPGACRLFVWFGFSDVVLRFFI